VDEIMATQYKYEPYLLVGNTKVSLADLPPEAWTSLTGDPDTGNDMTQLVRKVPWLNRGVDIRSKAVASMPFAIYNARGDEVDNSENYQNAVGYLPNLPATLKMIGRSICKNGREYQFIERLTMGTRTAPTGLRHMVAGSVNPKYAEKKQDAEAMNVPMGGLIGFERSVRGQVIPLEVDEVVYFWLIDDDVENGPPLQWPVMAAINAAGVLFEVDMFAKGYFKRGLVKTMIFGVGNNTIEQERNKLTSWLKRLAGSSKSWITEVINTDEIKPTIVGEGLESLANNDLSKDKREDIATALGVPHSLLFSNAANFATAQQDKRNFYEDTIIDECNFIGGVLNAQLLNIYGGYNIQFQPQRLDIFQEDEEQRASSYAAYVAADMRPSIAAEMLGLNLPPTADYADLDESYEIELENLSFDPIFVKEPEQRTIEIVEAEPQKTEITEIDPQTQDLATWQRICLKRVKSGKSPAYDFSSEHLEPVYTASIYGALEECETQEEVRAVFDDAWLGYP